jgi:hypothetical protein
MGRGGYNGGGPSAIFPQTDPLYVFAGREEHLSSILDSERANIIRCGRDLENERGGVQSEFGYLLNFIVETADATEQASWHKKWSRALRSRTPKEPKGQLKWILASELLGCGPRGPQLAGRYHLDHPEAPKPWGYHVFRLDE